MIGHDGGTIGQTSYLRLLLELDTTVRFIVNGAATDIYERVVREVVLGICGIEMPPSPRKGSSHVSGVADVVDTYTGIGQHLEVTDRAGPLNYTSPAAPRLFQTRRRQWWSR